MDQALAERADADPVQTAPLLDMLQASHEKLEARLFQS
jgi:urease accessory protein UreF